MRTGAETAATGAVLLATGVAIGAFGAHALGGRLDPDAMTTFETAARYHLIHGAALLALAALSRSGFEGLRGPGRVIASGIVIFAGALYLLALGGPGALGAVAPIGGSLMIAGWLWVSARLVAPRAGQNRSVR